MKIIKFVGIILAACTSLALATPACILEIPSEIEVSINQIVCTEEGIFLNLGGGLLPISAIFETDSGYKIIPKASEKMITCRNCGASNPNYFIRCWQCDEPL